MSFHTPAHKVRRAELSGTDKALENHAARCAGIAVPHVPATAPVCDFRYTNHGSIIILRPITGYAKEWAEVNLPDAASSSFGYSIEPRYFADILDGIDDEGLCCEPEGR